jgi:sarcosine oxidase subunit beta
VLRVWSGIEGYVTDMLPVLGFSRTTGGLVHAFGFCGHGFQLSPGVGFCLAELIADGAASIPIEAFSIGRFGENFSVDAERLTGEFDASLAASSLAPRPPRTPSHA